MIRKSVIPDIRVENDANAAVAPCGCALTITGTTPGLFYCPLHKAAADLLKACKAARVSLIDDEHYAEFKPLLETLEAAIAKATPPKPRDPDWFA